MRKPSITISMQPGREEKKSHSEIHRVLRPLPDSHTVPLQATGAATASCGDATHPLCPGRPIDRSALLAPSHPISPAVTHPSSSIEHRRDDHPSCLAQGNKGRRTTRPGRPATPSIKAHVGAAAYGVLEQALAEHVQVQSRLQLPAAAA